MFVSPNIAESSVTACKNQKFVEKVIGFGEPIEGVTKLEQLVSEGSDGISEFEIVSCDLATTTAFILLSSGTTGVPKGVMISHENVRTISSCIK